MKLSLAISLLLLSIITRAQFLEPTSKADVYKSINEYRIEHGLQPLKVSKKLERSSGRYAWRINWFHSEPKHDNIWLQTHKNCGELLGDSYRPIDGWSNSPPHSQILRGKRFTLMGVGKSGDNYVARLR